MSLYPKIPSNPREWQPGQLLTTYDAIREDKYDAFIRLRQKFPETYEDTHLWDHPVPFGEYNMFYSVRFGMIGVKAFTCMEYDDFGNQLRLTAFWFPDNQIVEQKVKERHGVDKVVVGAMNVPVEFHKPYITSYYKAQRVPVKHVSTSFFVTPDAFAPVGTKLDVRHFKVGQEVAIVYQETEYGFEGVVFRYGFDGGPVWLGDSKWQRRPGSIGAQGQKHVYPGQTMAGNTGGGALSKRNVPIWRIDYKNQLVYCVCEIDSDIGCYVKMIDMPNILGKTCWNVNRGLPPFPTFIPAKDEDLSRMATEECQLVSLPLYNRFMDEPHVTALVSQSDVDDARAAKPVAAPVKKNYIDYKKWLENRRKFAKKRREMRKVRLRGLRERAKERQDEARAEKLLKYRRVK